MSSDSVCFGNWLPTLDWERERGNRAGCTHLTASLLAARHPILWALLDAGVVEAFARSNDVSAAEGAQLLLETYKRVYVPAAQGFAWVAHANARDVDWHTRLLQAARAFVAARRRQTADVDAARTAARFTVPPRDPQRFDRVSVSREIQLPRPAGAPGPYY
jgi:hypothetical protein